MHTDAPPAMITLARELSAVGDARRWLADQLERTAGLAADSRDLVLLMASELVSNVIIHTDSEPQLAVSDAGTGVRVEVHDDDPRVPQPRAQEPNRVGGNGLLIVSSFSDDWGVDQVPDDGKVVWFTAGTGAPTV